MNDILKIFCCTFCSVLLILLGLWVGHSQSMPIITNLFYSMLCEISILCLFSSICLLGMLLLQTIKIYSGFKLWTGKFKAYLSSIEDEAKRIKKQTEALENGE